MAVVQNPIIGRARGKYGPAIFQTVYQKNILRSKPLIYRDPASPAQQLQRAKFQLATFFISKNLIPFRIGYANASPFRSAYSSAMSYFINNSMQFDGNQWSINYPNVMFSHGTLPGFLNPQVQVSGTSFLRVTFEDNSGASGASEEDIGHIIVFSTQMTQFYYVQTPYVRMVGSMKVDFNNWPSQEDAHIYIFATQSTGIQISNSDYLGTALIPTQQ